MSSGAAAAPLVTETGLWLACAEPASSWRWVLARAAAAEPCCTGAGCHGRTAADSALDLTFSVALEPALAKSEPHGRDRVACFALSRCPVPNSVFLPVALCKAPGVGQSPPKAAELCDAKHLHAIPQTGVRVVTRITLRCLLQWAINQAVAFRPPTQGAISLLST